MIYRSIHTHTFGSTAGSLQPVWSSACPLHSVGCFLKSRNNIPLRAFLGFERRKRSQGLRSGEGSWESTEMPFEVKKFCDGVGSVMIVHPFVCNVLSHANDPFSESIKDVLMKNLVTSTTDMVKTIPVEDFRHC